MRTISGAFYDKNCFPAYCYDKLLLGLIDSHRFVRDPDAFAMLERTTPHCPICPPRRSIASSSGARGKDQSYRWDESYTNPENLFHAYRVFALGEEIEPGPVVEIGSGRGRARSTRSSSRHWRAMRAKVPGSTGPAPGLAVDLDVRAARPGGMRRCSVNSCGREAPTRIHTASASG